MHTETDTASPSGVSGPGENGSDRATVFDPDFSPDVVADLYRHRPKGIGLTLPIAVLLGPLGGHRFYLGYFWSGVLMFLTAGGALVWWLIDLIMLKRLVDESNALEQERESAGLPPRSMAFLPPQSELHLNQLPAWAPLRAGRRRVIASGFCLAIIGFSLGTVSRATEFYEPVLVLCLFIVVSGLAARMPTLKHIPLINLLVRWVHRLRLFYHTVDPGSIWALVARSTVGIGLAPWRAKIRAEVRLHLQMGGLVVLMFSLVDLFELLTSGGFASGIALLLVQFVQSIVCTYLFVAPASALITTQLLLEAKDSIIWILSGITLFTLGVGFF